MKSVCDNKSIVFALPRAATNKVSKMLLCKWVLGIAVGIGSVYAQTIEAGTSNTNDASAAQQSSSTSGRQVIVTSADILIYTNEKCGFCTKVKTLLDEKGVKYRQIEVNTEAVLNEVEQKTGKRTVPQVFVNGKHVGSYKDLFFADMFNNLATLLEGKYAAA